MYTTSFAHVDTHLQTNRYLSWFFSCSSIAFPEKLEHFANKYSEHCHEKWSAEKVR